MRASWSAMKRVIALFSIALLAGLTGCERSERISSPSTNASTPAPPTLTAPKATNPTAITTPPVTPPPAATTPPATTPPPIPPPPAPPPPVAEEYAPTATDEVAVISTTKGDMVIQFWPDVAPKTVDNFKKLAKEKFYDGTAFHRIMKGFMIQGGDPKTKDPALKDEYGTGDPGYKIDAEFNERKHVRGVLSMARSASPNSAGSQFFICLGPQSFLDRQYTTFGKVVKGDEVLGAIGDAPVSPSPRGEMSVPNERIEVKSVKIVPFSEVK